MSATSTTMYLPAAPCPSLEAELRASREHARRLTEIYGAHASATAAAWDAVEEILATKAHLRAARRPTAFQTYCGDYPEAPEARAYDV